jgi:hypothetical protein
MADNGGARPGAGRVAGSKNKIPSKSLLAQQKFASLIEPKLHQYFLVLDEIALDTEKRPSDRIAAVKELLDRSMGRAQQSVVVFDASADHAVDGPSASDVLGLWDSVEAATVGEDDTEEA